VLVSAVQNLVRTNLQFHNQILKLAGGGLAVDDFNHLSSDLTDLGGLGIAGLLLLVGSSLSEAKGENTQVIAISGLHVNVSLNESLPLPAKNIL